MTGKGQILVHPGFVAVVQREVGIEPVVVHAAIRDESECYKCVNPDCGEQEYIQHFWIDGPSHYMHVHPGTRVCTKCGVATDFRGSFRQLPGPIEIVVATGDEVGCGLIW